MLDYLAGPFYRGYLAGVARHWKCKLINPINPYEKGTDEFLAWQMGYENGLTG